MGETNYRAVISKDPDDPKHWLVEVEGIAGVHSYGRSIREAIRNAREALGAALDYSDDQEDPEVDPVVLDTSSSLADLKEARIRYSMAERNLQSSLRVTAQELSELGITRADAGLLMEISKQRVQQILDVAAAG